ncbi:MAG: hypothetical protein U0457_18285 [Candidatus Sericytochromatia bacterium]
MKKFPLIYLMLFTFLINNSCNLEKNQQKTIINTIKNQEKNEDLVLSAKNIKSLKLYNNDFFYIKILDESESFIDESERKNLLSSNNKNEKTFKLNFNYSIYLEKLDKFGNKKSIKLNNNLNNYRGNAILNIDNKGNVFVVWEEINNFDSLIYSNEIQIVEKNKLNETSIYGRFYDINLNSTSDVINITNNLNSKLILNDIVTDEKENFNISFIRFNKDKNNESYDFFIKKYNKENNIKKDSILKNINLYDKDKFIFIDSKIIQISNIINSDNGAGLLIKGFVYNEEGNKNNFFEIDNKSSVDTKFEVKILNNKEFLLSWSYPYYFETLNKLNINTNLENSIELQKFDSNGNKLGEKLFSKKINGFSSSNLIINKDNSFVLFWKDSKNTNKISYTIYAQKFNSNGAKIENELELIKQKEDEIDLSIFDVYKDSENNTILIIKSVQKKNINKDNNLMQQEEKFLVKKFDNNLNQIN